MLPELSRGPFVVIVVALQSFLPKSCPLIFDSIIQPVLMVDFYHTGCQVELVVLFFGIETVIGIEMVMNLHHSLLRQKS